MVTAFADVIPTGDFIAEWMTDEGINAAELARRLGATPKHVSELLSGKAPLSHRQAIALERVTSIPARLWNMYESGYRDALARQAAVPELEAQYESARRFPLSYLRKWGFITAPARDHAETVRQLLSLLGAANLAAFEATWTQGSVAYRRSAVARDDAPALATWLALAERQHDRLRDVPRFDSAGLWALLPRIRTLTTHDPVNVDETVAALHAVGVVLCFVPAVPGLGIHGATRWVKGHPLIQLSLLWKSDDQFWFTLFHEVGHVLLHGHKSLFLNGDQTDEELEADRFAADVLIPPDDLPRMPRSRNIAAIRAFAEDEGIAPSIVLGRVQRESGDYGWGHVLRRKLEFKSTA